MTNNYSTTEVEAEEIEYKNETLHYIYVRFPLYYITLTNIVLYRRHTYNKQLQHNTCEKKNYRVNNVKITLNTLRIYTTIYCTY